MLDANNVPIGTYYYDGEGKRVKKVTDTETTVYVYSSGKLVAEYSTATPPANPTVNYTATDLLGSPRVLTNSLGEVVSRRDFLPFGEELYADGQSRTTANKYTTTGQDTVRKRFTGYEKDPETQLDFAEARMYENRFGRFTAVDPLIASGKSANPQTFNRFVYVINNPLRHTDPTGMQIGCDPNAGGGCHVDAEAEIVVTGVKYKGFEPRLIYDTDDAYDFRNDPKLAGMRDPSRDAENFRAISEFSINFPTGFVDRAKSLIDVPNYDLVPRLPGTAFSFTTDLPRISLTDLGFKSWVNYAPPATNGYAQTGRIGGALTFDFLLASATRKVGGSFAEARQATSVENFILTESPLFSARSASSTVYSNTGSYLHRFESGFFYSGKGPRTRMEETGRLLSKKYNDPLVSSESFPATSNRAAFINEHKMMMENGGPLSFDRSSPTYNKIRSPGCRLFCP